MYVLNYVNFQQLSLEFLKHEIRVVVYCDVV